MKEDKGGAESTKQPRTNKATEFLYNLSFDERFQGEVAEFRERFGIPAQGFIDKAERGGWRPKGDPIEFMSSMLDLLDKCLIPKEYYTLVQEYIETGSFETQTKPLEFVAFLDRYAHRQDVKQGNIEEWYRATEQPFVKMILLEGARNRSDLHAFIDANWDTIEEMFKEQSARPAFRVRKKSDKNKERDRLIIEFSKMSKKELGKERAKYKDLLIQNKMKELGYWVSEGYIRKIISKYRPKRN